MKFKLSGLIIFSIFTLLSLVAIQSYLVYNTYELKRKSLVIDARTAIARVYSSKEIDSVLWIYRNDFLRNLELYKKDSLSRTTLLQRLRTTAERNNSEFLKIYNRGITALDLGFDVSISKELNEIVLTDTLGNKEVLYTQEVHEPIFLAGSENIEDKAMLINTSTWQKDHAYPKGGSVDVVNLQFRSSIQMQIANFSYLLLRSLFTLLILSCLLFFFVVGLLHYSIRNLMKQKQIAQIKTDFINNITHELKTPLSTLSLATRTFRSSVDSGDRELTDETVAVIERQNVRMQKLIDQVLQSSLGYQGIKLETAEINLHNLLNEVLDDFELTLDEEVTLNRNLEHTGINARVDSFYIGTAIINILNNAVKYGGTELQVDYSVDQNNNLHLIAIKDNGIGIDKKYQKFIFEKFYRVGNKDIHDYKGLGLGLYYTKQIVNAHKGTISVISTKGEGSTLFIKIPIVS